MNTIIDQMITVPHVPKKIALLYFLLSVQLMLFPVFLAINWPCPSVFLVQKVYHSHSQLMGWLKVPLTFEKPSVFCDSVIKAKVDPEKYHFGGTGIGKIS